MSITNTLARTLTRIIGSRNERLICCYQKIIADINRYERSVIELSDFALRSKTLEFRSLRANGSSLDDLLPEAFAVVREAARRFLNMRHFDVQLIGGLVLHYGKIAEMRTGEGKTLVATLPAYLNSLDDKGVHIVTINDYLAERDAAWMGPIYAGLGLTVGVIKHGMDREEKQKAYNADVTYGTNNEFGFDYLRDNMALTKEDKMQRKLQYAIVDEVDSILIDESRTPLIISGAGVESSELYREINKIVPRLVKQEHKDGSGDFTIDEKNKQLYLTEEGHEHLEELLVKHGILDIDANLYDSKNIGIMHHVYAGLRAHNLFKRDIDYIVRNNEIIIVDEHTGRAMVGRRWSDGLHQAVEAKEHVEIQSENQTLASITFQNYFRLYAKLAGMTGTADTEAYEFQEIYNLEVVVVPTHKKSIRKDLQDVIYMTQEEKFTAIIADIMDCQKRKQPVLVGTISIESSEFLSQLLKRNNVVHRVLNAKFHEQEAEIVAEAGRPGTVTIATNMAGRGTDIVLGGNLQAELAKEENAELHRKIILDWEKRNKQVIKAGGLHIIGSERHESRRIDNQLRGRSGRQGDPGSTRFYLSLQDNLMRIFISDRMQDFMKKLSVEKNTAIDHPWLSKAIENAQKKVEGHNFDIRKQLLEFDDIANDQRIVIYEQRNALLEVQEIKDFIIEIRQELVNELVDLHFPPESFPEEWKVVELEHTLQQEFGVQMAIKDMVEKNPSIDVELIKQKVQEQFDNAFANLENVLGDYDLRKLEKIIMLETLDQHWKEHLSTMEHLRNSIHLQGYAQKDPKQEYKRQAFLLFSNMLADIKRRTISALMLIKTPTQEELELLNSEIRTKHEQERLMYQHESSLGNNDAYEDRAETYVRADPKVGRNDPCPCGSGEKYKYCHGKI